MHLICGEIELQASNHVHPRWKDGGRENKIGVHISEFKDVVVVENFDSFCLAEDISAQCTHLVYH